MKGSLFICFLSIIFLYSCKQEKYEKADYTVEKWDKITLSFQGPATHELAEDNPFQNYRLIVTFTNGNSSYAIQGFYAADGNAAESGADSGNIWQVRFVPDLEGTWDYSVSFRKGKDIAISDNPNAGEAVFFDGEQGKLEVTAISADAKGFQTKGRLSYTGERYLQFAETGEYFIKGGADSPENFLAFTGFDGTYMHGDTLHRKGEAKPEANLHKYEAHIKDWQEGDPTWQNNKGKGIIGGLNYLVSKGMNSVYFLTMNIEGDGKDVWPYVSHQERTRFDCSKLNQWEIVFDHMDDIGLMLHMVLQETENEMLLDNGNTGPERKLYYRELIARFGHHLAITWNMGEENGPVNFSPNGQNTRQQKDMVRYIKKNNPYNAFAVIHTHSQSKDRHEIFTPLLGYEFLDGPSMQMGDIATIYDETKYWLQKSDSSGHQWVVMVDEIGPASRGVDPDDRKDNNQDSVRNLALWGNLMAGGGGVEWYFGYQNPHNDLGMEDWRSRDRMWDYTRHALNFFQRHIPFHEMQSIEGITSLPAYVLAKEDEIMAAYFPQAGKIELDLNDFKGEYSVQWYNPRTGGELLEGSVKSVTGAQKVSIGTPPDDSEKDWVVMVKKK